MCIRDRFLKKQGSLEIELPVLSPALIPESYLEVFETQFDYFENHKKLYLTPSPELFLKRLLAYNIGNCYYLGKSFRNHEKSSSLHEFEFNMLEFYKVKTDYMGIADELLKMLRFITKKIFKKSYLFFQRYGVSVLRWMLPLVLDLAQIRWCKRHEDLLK